VAGLRIDRLASGVILAGAGIFLCDLFLDWHRVSVLAGGGAVDVRASSSGWTGWGGVAGVLAIALVLWQGREAAAAAAPTVLNSLVTAGLAVGTLGCALDEAVGGSATVSATPVTLVQVGARLWPAWVGVGLAAAVALAALAQMLVRLPPVERPHPPRLHAA
jgi:hypothetical protein